jgi:hypothetical protein
MNIRKSLAGVAAGSLAIAGVAVVAAPAAQAATYTTVWNGINNTGLQPNQNIGTKNVTVNVTGGATVGSPITVSVTSSDIAFDNGPAATVQANWTRIDAVVGINGTDYLIKGPSNTGAAPINTNIIAAGWTISSANGADSGTGAGGAVTNTDGVATLNADGTIANASASLVAPGVAGTYTVTLKRLINNSVSSVAPASGGTGVDAVNDGFDQIWGLNTGVAPYNGATAANNFGTVATLNVIGPGATIATSTGQNAGVAAVRAPLPPATGWAGGPTVIGLNGSVFGANVAAGGFTAQFCDVTGTTCDVPVGGTITNNIATNASGDFVAGSSITLTRTSFSPFITSGSRTIKLTQGANVALVPVQVLGTPTVTVSPASAGLGATVQVSGANFNPSQAITLTGRTGAVSPYGNGGGSAGTATTDTASATSNGTGAFGPTSLTISVAGTNGVSAAQGTGSNLTVADQRGTAGYEIASGFCTAPLANGSLDQTTAGSDYCTTTQNVNATVTGGTLSQDVATYSIGAVTSTSAGTAGTYTNVVASGTNGGVGNLAKMLVTVVRTSGVAPVGADITITSLGQGYKDGETVTIAAGATGAGSAAITFVLNRTPGTDINFGTVSTNTVAQTLTSAINPIRVTDLRGGAAGWSLTAALTSSVKNAANNTIPDGNLALGSISCANSTFTTLNATAGTAGTFAGATTAATARTVCTGPAAVNGSSSGEWTASAPVSLTVPAFQAAGSYTGTITFTLT